MGSRNRSNGIEWRRGGLFERLGSDRAGRALGVSMPTYTNPATGETTTKGFSTNNRQSVLNLWPFRSQHSAPRAASELCTVDCAAENRASCGVDDWGMCGDCLPDYYAYDGTCWPRMEAESDHPVSDGKFISSEFSAPASGGSQNVIIPLQPGPDLIAVQLYFGSLDSQGEPNFEWAENGSTIWTSPRPSSYVHRDGAQRCWRNECLRSLHLSGYAFESRGGPGGLAGCKQPEKQFHELPTGVDEPDFEREFCGGAVACVETGATEYGISLEVRHSAGRFSLCRLTPE